MTPADSAAAVALPFAAPAPAPAPVPVPAPAPARPRRDVAAIIADLHAVHGAELLRFCRWMLKDPDDAADALQDTWIRAMTALGADRVAVTALRPWLYAIARNTCLDRLRDRRRCAPADLDESSAGEAPPADEVLALRQEAGAALALVGQLSDRQRSALMMRELAGMPVPEIAQVLGVTPERAAWTIADARRALDESRAGADLACEDARARLGAGHRGRTLRAHLGTCSACVAHDRRLRARRVLAPAFVPVLWIKRLLLPLFANPAGAATLAAAAVAAGAVAPHPPAHRSEHGTPAASDTRAAAAAPEGAGVHRRPAPSRPAAGARGRRSGTDRATRVVPAPPAPRASAPRPVIAATPVTASPDPAAAASPPERRAPLAGVSSVAGTVVATVTSSARTAAEGATAAVQQVAADLPVAPAARTVAGAAADAVTLLG